MDAADANADGGDRTNEILCLALSGGGSAVMVAALIVRYSVWCEVAIYLYRPHSTVMAMVAIQLILTN